MIVNIINLPFEGVMTVYIPADHLSKTWIFHITALENLPRILESGYLLAKNHLGGDYCSIANEEIQKRRVPLNVSVAPYGQLHDYVPFYFAPRSPMLGSNHTKNIINAIPQDKIIYLVTTAQTIAEAGLPYVFYDRHAVNALAQAYNDCKDLDKIDWELFFESPLLGGYSKFFQDKHDENHPKWIKRMETRQAEFLVYERLDWQFIKGVATINSDVKEEVKVILSRYGQTTKVIAKPEWYF